MNIVSLLEELVNSLNEAEEKFYKNPKDFHALETSVKSTTEAFSAAYLSTILNDINNKIYNDAFRKSKYTVQRNDTRTIISSVGDITFENTYYRKNEDGTHHYLTEELIGLATHERFTEEAEAVLLTEAMKTSYSEATRCLPSKQKITKTTVMNKVHGIADEIPFANPEKKKSCKYLFIEADEDHVAEQHGRWTNKDENNSFISKLAYIYEYKQATKNCQARKELVNTFYFGGVYSGSDGVEKFWKNIQTFIELNYKYDDLINIYISGDGASWIKQGATYLSKALFCADRFHMMKYINAASNQMLDEKDIAKSNIYRLLHKKDKKGFKSYTNEMILSANNSEPIEALQTFVLGNWSAVMRTYHCEIVDGCSAEGHVSHILSDRLSSRPMGWSKQGADRMSKLRCYEKNYGREKIISLVKYSREQRKLARTGTDVSVDIKPTLRQLRTEHYSQAKSYIDRLQATIPGTTMLKTISIRQQLKLI